MTEWDKKFQYPRTGSNLSNTITGEHVQIDYLFQYPRTGSNLSNFSTRCL